MPKPSKPQNTDVLNMTEAQLIDERNTLLTKIDVLDEVVNTGNEWSEDQRDEYRQHVDRLEAVTNRIGSTTEGLRERADALRVVSNLARLSSNAHTLNGNISVRPRFEDDPKYGFADDREFLSEVVNLYRNGGSEDQRIRAVINAVGDDEYSRGNWEAAGLFVPRGFLGTVLTTPAESDFMSPLMTRIPMSAPTVDINARVDKDHSTSVTGGTIAYRTSETKTVSLTKDRYEQVSLKLSELNVASAATRQIMRDSPISIAALIEQSQREAQNYKRMDEFLNGSGNGCPLGVLNVGNAALLELDRTAGQADAKILTGLDVLKMRKRVWGYNQAVWIANIDLYDIIVKLAIESDNNAGIVKLFYPMDPQAGLPDRLLGRPIYFTEFAPGITSGQDGSDVTEWDTHFLSCVNFSQYLYGTRGNSTTDRSIHVRFLEREELFLFTSEDDGRPWWKTVMTPKNGVSTQSPFVTITNTSVAA